MEAESIKIGGDDFDQAIRRFLKEKFSLLVGQRTAEAIKIRAAGCLQEDFDETLRIKGQEPAHRPARGARDGHAGAVSGGGGGCAAHCAERKPGDGRAAPELAGDLYAQGIVLTGGGARLRGLPDYLAGALRVPVRLAEHASSCAARGAARGRGAGKAAGKRRACVLTKNAPAPKRAGQKKTKKGLPFERQAF